MSTIGHTLFAQAQGFGRQGTFSGLPAIRLSAFGHPDLTSRHMQAYSKARRHMVLM
ncbi:hypothetical protein [Leeia oryzae]|uniref:hypothetical protein n=1 Tax=Leeia oryzae TaxID=356662 RepID=UPI0003635A6F|nr:hypothetical protein [Leeia oryzae]